MSIHPRKHVKRSLLPLTCLAACGVFATPVAAFQCGNPGDSNVFNVAACVDGDSKVLGFNKISDAVESLQDEALAREFPNYQQEVSAVTADLNIRGLKAKGGYAQNSSALVFSVPDIGIYETFDGGNRDASNDLFEEWLKKNGDDILRELTRVSPVDPMAGNPTSLQSLMANTSYDIGTDPMYNDLPQGSAFGVGLRFGRYSSGPYTQDLMTIPLNYTYSFDSGDQLIVSLPLTYVDTEGAVSYSANLGVGYKKKISDRWAITPSVGYGAVGSVDLGAAGQIMSASVTSDYLIVDNSRYRLRMGNMAGYYVTIPTTVGEYQADYRLTNEIIRNGLSLSVPLNKKFRGQQLAWHAYIIDTRYFGDELYSEYTDEIGVTLGTYGGSGSNPIQVGLKYMFGDGDVDSIDLSFGYKF